MANHEIDGVGDADQPEDCHDRARESELDWMGPTATGCPARSTPAGQTPCAIPVHPASATTPAAE